MANPITNMPKKSQDIGEHEYKLGDIVLAKVRGYPQWPGQVSPYLSLFLLSTHSAPF